MVYSGEQYAFLFDQSPHITDNAFEDLRHDQVARYRCKTITSGNQVEVEIYPIWDTRNAIREARANATREAQRKLNARNAQKQFIRLANCNFGEGDLAITLTYKGKPAPTIEQAQKDITNFIKRLRRYCAKQNIDLRYLYVIEGHDPDTDSPLKRVHLHMLLPAMDRDAVERLWDKGFTNTKRLQPDDNGIEAISRYMLKDPKGRKRWGGSRNLRKPKITSSDHRLSRRQVEQLVLDLEVMSPAIFSRHYPNCILNEMPTIRTSSLLPGAYIYARMHKDVADRRRSHGRSQGEQQAYNHIPCWQNHRRSGLPKEVRAGGRDT